MMSDMIIEAGEALAQLARWLDGRTWIGALLSVPGGGATVSLRAQLVEVGEVLVLSGPSGQIRFSLNDARYETGPLSALAFPLQGRIGVAISQRPQGLLPVSGLHVRLGNGVALFLCEGDVSSGVLPVGAIALPPNRHTS